jgi:transcriptional regulator with XRE-family HTH domain
MLVNKIKGKIRERGLTEEQFSKLMGFSHQTLRRKFKRGIMGSDEIELAVEILEIENPVPIFFEKWVTSQVTKSIN